MLALLSVALLLLPSPLLAAPALPRASHLNPKAAPIRQARWVVLSPSFRIPGEPTPTSSTTPSPARSTSAASPIPPTTVAINQKYQPARRAYTADKDALTHLPRALATPVSLHEKRGANWLLPPRGAPLDDLPPVGVIADGLVAPVLAQQNSTPESAPAPSPSSSTASEAPASPAPSSGATTKTTSSGATVTDKQTDPLTS